MNEITLLRAAIPAERGPAYHTETGNEPQAEATTRINKLERSQRVEQIKTPDEPIKRVHEMLHARHTDEHARWPKVSAFTSQIIEDVKLHVQHWPWEAEKTPKIIADSIERVCDWELRNITEATERLRGISHFESFVAHQIQAINAQRLGSFVRTLSLPGGRAIVERHRETCALTDGEFSSLEKICGLCRVGDWQDAAQLFQSMVKLPAGEDLANFGGISGGPGEPGEPGEEHISPFEHVLPGEEQMFIRELPRTIPTSASIAPKEESFFSSSGRTLNWRELIRGKLKRPYRCFERETEEEILGGTILIDASGSMSLSEKRLASFCALFPAATIAYYFGTGHARGYLCIYAANGKRANSCPIRGDDNSIDGSALDWLLRRPEPRYFITDEGFCGSPRSGKDLVRLQLCIGAGLVKVLGSVSSAEKHFKSVRAAQT